MRLMFSYSPRPCKKSRSSEEVACATATLYPANNRRAAPAALDARVGKLNMGNSIPKISFRLLRGRYLLFFGWQNRYNRTLMWRTFCFCVIAALAGAAAVG